MANVEKMNVHQALCEIKLLDKRILDEINNMQAVGVTKKVTQMVGTQTVEKFKTDASSHHQKIIDLIRRRGAIKTAVVLSNAITKVTVGDKEYTIAEAIEMKNHGMDGKRELRKCLAYQLKMAENSIVRTNETNEMKADNYIRECYGNKENKAGASEIQAAREGYLTGLTVELVDPIDIREVIKALDEEIHKFDVEVDAALSTSNATTELTIEY